MGFFLRLAVGFLLSEGIQSREICETQACKNTAYRILQYMDPSYKPCQNFYRFVCGSFIKTAEIHDDKTQNSSFSQVGDLLEAQLKSIVLEPTATNEPLPYTTMKNLFSLCMDENKIDSQGTAGAVALLEAVGGWPVLGHWKAEDWSVLKTEIQLRKMAVGGGSLFTLSVSVDAKNTSRRVIEIDQAGLGLPRELLVMGREDPIVTEYYRYMVDTAILYGADRLIAERQLNESLLFEIRLANLTVPREKRRDFDRMYNLYTLQTLINELGWVRWDELLQEIVPQDIYISRDEAIVVNEVEYLKKLKVFLHNYPDEVVANHMMWHAASGMANALTTAMRDRYQQFKKVVVGTTAREPRWKECVSVASRVVANHMMWHAASGMANALTTAMRDRYQQFKKVVVGTTAREPRWKECVSVASSLALALSSAYVKRFFDETSKKEALLMTENIRNEISKDLMEVDWMDQKTRERAKHKASKVVQHIGYPDELTDNAKIEQHYGGLKLNKENYLEAILDLAKWAVARRFRRLREPVNKTDWRSHGDVAQVNAFYNPVENSMQFPAGILQQPFFSSQVPKYVNYGTIGYIIAHEITHGFDDQGSQFDSEGELKNWWEEESMKKFKEKKKCFIDQYGSFVEPQTNLTLNGINTQGENVADAAGLKLSYRAYRRLSLNFKEPSLPGLTHFTQDQLFMISMANMWCTRYRPEALQYQITTGVHSPPEYRVNGALMNLPEFSRLFQCKPLEPMNPPDKCAVW